MTFEEIQSAGPSVHRCRPMAGSTWPSTTARAPPSTAPRADAYIDFASGIGVASLGYGHPAWVKAVTEQARQAAATPPTCSTPSPTPRLAEKLCKRTGMADVFFANGGGEANEGMIKLARKYSFDKYGMGRATIITLHNSFHGRTITTLHGHRSGRVPQLLLPLHRGLPLRRRQRPGLRQGTGGQRPSAPSCWS